ncbi:MAG: hypothetical protein V3S46_08990 [Nitrospinota bacterium]
MVSVTVLPEISLPEEVRKLSVRKLAGNPSCAGALKATLESLISQADIYTLDTSGLEDPDETVIITGKVEECEIASGHGVMGVSFEMEHRGEKGRAKYISRNTNRPGAPAEEVKRVLAKRVAAEYIRLFMPTTRSELREFKNADIGDPGVTAAMNGNWDLAIKKWTDMIIKNPKDDKSLYNRGVAYEAKSGVKNLKKAIRDYKAAAALSSDGLYAGALARAQGALDSLRQKIRMKKEIGE